MLHLVKALAAQGTRGDLWLVTRGAQAVGDEPNTPNPFQATLWGLGPTLRLEHPELSPVLDDAFLSLRGVDVNIARFVAERGWTREEAVAYHRRWALSSEERAQKAFEFLADGQWGTYVVTYLYGYRLVREYVRRDPGNFCRLLTEQLTTADLAV